MWVCVCVCERERERERKKLSRRWFECRLTVKQQRWRRVWVEQTWMNLDLELAIKAYSVCDSVTSLETFRS